MQKKGVSTRLLVIALLALVLLSISAYPDDGAQVNDRISATLAQQDKVSVIVLLKGDDAPAQVAKTPQAIADELQSIRSKVDANQEQFKAELAQDTAARGISAESAEITHEYYALNAVAMTVDAAGLEALKDNPLVEQVIPDTVRHISDRGALEGGHDISINESVPLISGDDVANITIGGINLTGKGEAICVIDTGIDTSHLLFGPVIEASNIVGGIYGGYDFVNNDSNATDDNSHGTHVSGIAVGNFSPFFGVARNAQVIPIKVCDAGGSCPDSAIVAGVDYCVNNATAFATVSVLSGSIGGAPAGGYTSTNCATDSLYAALEPLLSTAVGMGITPVFAAGNSAFTTGVDYPACSPNAISVGSTTKADAISSFSNRGGDRFDVYAPGSSILSSIPFFNLLGIKSGTSMATPHISGAIAVIQQNQRINGRAVLNLTVIRSLLQQYGRSIAPNNTRIDLYALITKLNENYSINVSGNSIRNDSSGTRIQYQNATDFGVGHNITGCIELQNGSIKVNSTNCPQFNKLAHVVLAGVRVASVPLRNGQDCPASICQNVTLTTAGLEMDVTGFSNYTTAAGCPLTINTSTSLNQSISSNHTCITFGADNIELDCQGFTIQYSNVSTGYGINATGRNNVTVRNCNVIAGPAAVSVAHGIVFSGTNSSLIVNTSVTVLGTQSSAVILNESVHGNVISNGSFAGSGSQVIHLTNATNNTFENLTLAATGPDAMRLDGSSSGNNITSIGITSAGQIDLNLLSGSDFNRVTNSNFTNSLGIVFQIDTSRFNQVAKNIFTSTGGGAIAVLLTNNAFNNSLINNTASTPSNIAILVSNPGSTNNEIDNNYASAGAASLGIDIQRDNNIVRDNIGTGNVGIGVSGSNNTVINNSGIGTFAGFQAVGTLHTFTNNSGQSGAGIGFQVTGASNSNFSRINGTSISGDGIQFQTSTGNTMTNSTGQSGTGLGIHLISGSNSNNLTNNTGSSGTSNGIDIDASGFNNLTGNLANSLSEGAIYITNTANNNRFVNNTFVASGLAGALEYGNNGGSNNQFFNTTLQSNSSWIKIEDTPTNNNTYNNTLFDSPNGSIRIPGNFTPPSGLITIGLTNMSITANASLVNSSQLPFLNQSAQIILRNISFQNPLPVVDIDDNGTFISCPIAQCTEVSYAGGVFTFNVTHFTTYAAAETLPNITITKTDSPDPVPRGGQLRYTITLNNTGGGIAYNVSVVDIYPQITFASSNPTSTGNVNTFFFQNLSVNASTTINITVIVNNTLANATVINNTVFINYSSFNSVNLTANASQNTTVVGLPNISTNKSANQTFVIKGTTLNYTITVNNSGDDTAFNVSVNESFPAGITLISSVPATSGPSKWNLGNLSPNQSTTINISVSVSVSLTNATIRNNTFNVTVANRNGTNITGSNSTTVTVLGYPQVSVTKTAPGALNRGSVLTYQVTITNNGDEIAYNVTAFEGYPANVVSVSAAPPASVGNNTFALGNLLPGQTKTINITINTSQTFAGLLNNTVNVTFANVSGTNLTLNATALTTMIAPTQGGGSGSGSGAGASSSTATTQSMSGNFMTTDYLARNSKVFFDVQSIQHTLTIMDVAADQIKIRIASVPQEFTLAKKAVQLVDVDGDGKNDLRVEVMDIAYSKALLVLEKLSSATVPSVQAAPVPKATPAPKPVEKPVEKLSDATVGKTVESPPEIPVPLPSKRSVGKFVVSGLLVLIAGGLVGYMVIRNRPIESLPLSQKIDAPLAPSQPTQEAAHEPKKAAIGTEKDVQQAARKLEREFDRLSKDIKHNRTLVDHKKKKK